MDTEWKATLNLWLAHLNLFSNQPKGTHGDVAMPRQAACDERGRWRDPTARSCRQRPSSSRRRRSRFQVDLNGHQQNDPVNPCWTPNEHTFPLEGKSARFSQKRSFSQNALEAKYFDARPCDWDPLPEGSPQCFRAANMEKEKDLQGGPSLFGGWT